jgi:predicted transcriptional regulator
MKIKESFFELKNDTARIILGLQDEAILARVREILEEAEGADGGWYDSLDDEDRASVDRADADIAAGRLHSHEEVKAELKQWLKE